jgi:maltooligosyltrehalose trehalohydrolase
MSQGEPLTVMSPPVLGARLEEGGTRFGLFAAPAEVCTVRLLSAAGLVTEEHPMQPSGGGFFEAFVPGAGSGTLYKLVVDGRELSDPFARFLPHGVTGPAEVLDDAFEWRHGPGVFRPRSELVIYELHVGTFTDEGTYAGARARLPAITDLGVSAVEVMPLAAFPGRRGWGYDGVAPFAPFAPYGRPDDLRGLIDEAHRLGLLMILDVVYNHFGPGGNCLPEYCPAYLQGSTNSWGAALDYTHPVLRRMLIENALYWLGEFRFDGLRLDAAHAIDDPSSPNIIREISDAVASLQPPKTIIAEDNRNDPAILTSDGVHAVWADDFHHQVRVTMTGERDGYFCAYTPGVEDLARIINRGWLYEGQLYPPTRTSRGAPADGLEASAFVYCLQNHDQVGNRALGERLCATVSPDEYRAASTLLLFLPMTPLLFMGQEWAASSPFLYFTDHEPELGRQVSEGRRREFASFEAFRDAEGRARIPDPQSASTYHASRLRWTERHEGEHGRVLELYTRMLSLRAGDPVLRDGSRRRMTAEARADVLIVRRAVDGATRTLVVNFGSQPVDLRGALPTPQHASGVAPERSGPRRERCTSAEHGRSPRGLSGSIHTAFDCESGRRRPGCTRTCGGSEPSSAASGCC